MSWQGIRANESLSRSKMAETEETPEGYTIYRPILNWDVYDVFKQHDKHGIKPNPLYKQGMGRVGCMPCINSKKEELYELLDDSLKKLRGWHVGKRLFQKLLSVDQQLSIRVMTEDTESMMLLNGQKQLMAEYNMIF